MAHYAIRPFCTIHMEVINTGVKPATIKSLSPVWLAPGGMVKVAETTNCHVRRGTLRGGSLTFDANGAPMLALLNDPGSAVTVAIGALREGETESAGRFSTDSAGWGGEISSSYSPPCELKPGNTLCADPVGIFLSQDGMEAVENAYLWAQYQFCQAPVASGAPSYWVTVGETETADELLRAARAWAGSVAAHVLVPASWQVPDSTYPGDMRLFADQIVKAGMVPGIAIDPLRAGKGLSGPHIAAGPDGALWINPAAAKGRAAAADQVHAAVEWGYRFFVLRNSDMPDTVLSQFGLTRGQADKMALDILRDNGGDRPILAASTATLNADTRAWEAAAQSVAGVQAYGLSPGAVRIDMAEVKDISDELVQAMAAYEGPIEIVGRPVGKAKRQLAEVVMAQRKYKANASGIRAAQAEKKSR